MKRVSRIITIMFFCMAIAFSITSIASAKKLIKTFKITSNYGKSVHVAVGKKVKVKTTIVATPNTAKNRKYKYSSTKKKIATVSSSGYVKGIKKGTCKVQATSKVRKNRKTSIKVTVVKPVTSISLEASDQKIYLGGSFDIKKTVYPTTGSYNAVKWSSTNKKVLTVTQSGLVKAVGTGTATIKATSVEGSNVTGSIKIKVFSKDTVNLSSLEMINSKVVRATLDKAAVLEKDDFVLNGKTFATSDYIKTYDIKKIRNYDNKTYDIYLNDEKNLIKKNSYLKLTINKLPGNGTKSIETHAVGIVRRNKASVIWTYDIGEDVNEIVDFEESEYLVGDIIYEIEGQVNGVDYKVVDNTVYFSGKINQLENGTKITVKGTDELGNKATEDILILVGDKDNIMGAPLSESILLLKDESDFDLLSNLYICGGSGEYEYSSENLPAGLVIKSSGKLIGAPSCSGEVTSDIKVTDKKDSNIFTNIKVKFSVKDSRRVSGKILDDKGEPVKDAHVECYDIINDKMYSSNASEDGTFLVMVTEGTYDIMALSNDGEEIDSVYSIVVGAGGRNLDFVYTNTKSDDDNKTDK